MNPSFAEFTITRVFMSLLHFRQEPVNYLGYYSSHEEAMQTLMMEEVEDAKKYISWMVTQGTFDCETHILWNKLLCSSPAVSLGSCISFTRIHKY